MMELNATGNVMTRLGVGEEGKRLFHALEKGADSPVYNLSMDGYEGISLGSGWSEMNLNRQNDLILNQNSLGLNGADINSEGMIVDLVRTLTSSLSKVVDLVQGAFLGDGTESKSTFVNDSRGSPRDLNNTSSQGLFGALGSIAGNMVDKMFTQIPFLGGRSL